MNESAPATATEQRLAGIWTALLGAAPASVNDSFLALQGSRDLMGEMLAEVRRNFQVFADGAVIESSIERPTIKHLAELIDSMVRPPSKIIVALQPHGNGRPLFLIHAAGGDVFSYRALTKRLGKTRPIYGVRGLTRFDSPGPALDAAPGIESLAARYIEEIRTVQPVGPYSFGGACLGGVIAFEMARQLRAEGERIAGPLILFDAIMATSTTMHAAPGVTTGWRSPHRASLVRRVLTDPRLLLRAPRGFTRRLRTSRGAIALLDRLGSATRNARWIGAAHRSAMQRNFDAGARLLADYVPVPSADSVVLIRAERGYDDVRRALGPKLGWEGMALGGIILHDMPGEHAERLDMMNEPLVAETAALVSRYLDGRGD